MNSEYNTIAWKYNQGQLEEIFSKMVKIKQVIAGLPITKGGSKCDYSCDTENHHLHFYCKWCQKNLPYNTTIHKCKMGLGLGIGQIHPDMNPEYLANHRWWTEPPVIAEENRTHYIHHGIHYKQVYIQENRQTSQTGMSAKAAGKQPVY